MESLSPPWELFGEAMIARVRIPPHRAPGLPKGVHRLPGLPALVIAERFSSSPAGEFLSIAVGIPSRLGLRPGLAFVVSAVSSESIRLAARNNWGYPTELADLRWGSVGRERELEWSERNIVVKAIPATVPFPFMFRFRSLQRREDGAGVTPVVLRGLARRAQIGIELREDDPLAWLSGTHRGTYLSSNRVRIHPLRTPMGLVSTLRAPLTPNPRLRPGEAQYGS